ncbi:MAG: hypothetical protein ACKVJN_17850, partial [Woeseiales bacterium]
RDGQGLEPVDGVAHFEARKLIQRRLVLVLVLFGPLTKESGTSGARSMKRDRVVLVISHHGVPVAVLNGRSRDSEGLSDLGSMKSPTKTT